jgi:hypothetical protein
MLTQIIELKLQRENRLRQKQVSMRQRCDYLLQQLKNIITQRQALQQSWRETSQTSRGLLGRSELRKLQATLSSFHQQDQQLKHQQLGWVDELTQLQLQQQALTVEIRRNQIKKEKLILVLEEEGIVN